MSRKPKLAVWKFSSCDGCQLSILDLEDELLELSEFIEIANFPEASRKVVRGPYDISLVEGSISTPEEKERIVWVREQSKILVSIGACASSGGIQALRNFEEGRGFISKVYTQEQWIDVLQHSEPISAHVDVDYELRGCPVEKGGILDLLASILIGRNPRIPEYSLCLECKRKGITCLMITENAPCMGPVTAAGCGALCTSFGRACYGCFGPKEGANTDALAKRFKKDGMSSERVAQLFSKFNAWSEAFRKQREIL